MYSSQRKIMRVASPMLLVVVDTAHILLLRHTKTMGSPYSNSAAVAMSVRVAYPQPLCITMGMIGNTFRRSMHNHPSPLLYPAHAMVQWCIGVAWTIMALLSLLGPMGTARVIHRGVICKPREVLKLTLPSVLWVIQDNLMYLALDNVDAVVYLILKQLKILSTAVCAVLLLNKRLTLKKWLSLLMLMSGVVVVQLSKIAEKGHAAPSSLREENKFVGLLAVLGCVLISGFAGTYFEMILKKSNGGQAPSAAADDGIWVRNMQLYVSTLPAVFIYGYLTEGKVLQEKGFFHGFSGLLWVVLVLQALGGLVNSMIINYLDNIAKMFASGYVFLATLLMEIWIYEFRPTLWFGVGSLMVNVASLLYGGAGSGWCGKRSSISASQLVYVKQNDEGIMEPHIRRVKSELEIKTALMHTLPEQSEHVTDGTVTANLQAHDPASPLVDVFYEGRL